MGAEHPSPGDGRPGSTRYLSGATNPASGGRVGKHHELGNSIAGAWALASRSISPKDARGSNRDTRFPPAQRHRPPPPPHTLAGTTVRFLTVQPVGTADIGPSVYMVLARIKDNGYSHPLPATGRDRLKHHAGREKAHETPAPSSSWPQDASRRRGGTRAVGGGLL